MRIDWLLHSQYIQQLAASQWPTSACSYQNTHFIVYNWPNGYFIGIHASSKLKKVNSQSAGQFFSKQGNIPRTCLLLLLPVNASLTITKAPFFVQYKYLTPPLGIEDEWQWRSDVTESSVWGTVVTPCSASEILRPEEWRSSWVSWFEQLIETITGMEMSLWWSWFWI